MTSFHPAAQDPARGYADSAARWRTEAGGAAVPAGGVVTPAAGRLNQPGTSQSVTTWNMDPVIELTDLRKSFGSLTVLDGVTCRIPRGGVTALMGPSGTGKSVSLRHIVGLTPSEIAQLMGRTESSIHGLHHRGRRSLQQELSRLGAAPATAVRQTVAA